MQVPALVISRKQEEARIALYPGKRGQRVFLVTYTFYNP